MTGTQKIFGLFADPSPDRWGRVLINKRERILAEKEGRKPPLLIQRGNFRLQNSHLEMMRTIQVHGKW